MTVKRRLLAERGNRNLNQEQPSRSLENARDELQPAPAAKRA